MSYGASSKNARMIFYSLLMLFIYLLTVSPNALPKVASVSAIPVIPLVVFISMFENDLTGSVFGIIGGILLDVTSSMTPGFNTVVLLIIGTVCGLLASNLMRNNLRSAIFLTFISCTFYFVAQWLVFTVIGSRGHIFFTFFRFNFIAILYTTFYIIPIYLIFRLFIKRYKKRDKNIRN